MASGVAREDLCRWSAASPLDSKRRTRTVSAKPVPSVIPSRRGSIASLPSTAGAKPPVLSTAGTSSRLRPDHASSLSEISKHDVWRVSGPDPVTLEASAGRE